MIPFMRWRMKPMRHDHKKATPERAWHNKHTNKSGITPSPVRRTFPYGASQINKVLAISGQTASSQVISTIHCGRVLVNEAFCLCDRSPGLPVAGRDHSPGLPVAITAPAISSQPAIQYAHNSMLVVP